MCIIYQEELVQNTSATCSRFFDFGRQIHQKYLQLPRLESPVKSRRQSLQVPDKECRVTCTCDWETEAQASRAGRVILILWTYRCRRDARAARSREGAPARLSSRITPRVRGMLDPAARTPSHPKWQEERVLQRTATFLSARFLTIRCILPDSVPICCRFSKNLFYSEKLKQRNSTVKIEPFMSRKQK